MMIVVVVVVVLMIRSRTELHRIDMSCAGNTADGRGRGKPVQITEAWWSGRVPGTPVCCVCFCLSRQYQV
jgi:hypothetical protein